MMITAYVSKHLSIQDNILAKVVSSKHMYHYQLMSYSNKIFSVGDLFVM